MVHYTFFNKENIYTYTSMHVTWETIQLDVKCVLDHAQIVPGGTILGVWFDYSTPLRLLNIELCFVQYYGL